VVRACDPLAREAGALLPEVARVELSAEVVAWADAVVLVCPQPGMDLGLLGEASWVLDTRGMLEGTGVERL
jgi:phosphoglycerate dehydrogenase-like enzyme